MYPEIRDPADRVKAVCNYGCNVEVDENIPVRRYYRSGIEMMRMADSYYEDKYYEKAFILYSKFITLFVEKVPKHSAYKSEPGGERSKNKAQLLKVFQRAEQVKKILLERYVTEEEQRRKEEERLEKEAKKLQKQQTLLIKQRKEQEKLEADRQREEYESRCLEEEQRRRSQDEQHFKELQEEELNRRMQQLPKPGAEQVLPQSTEIKPLPSAPPIPDRSSKPLASNDNSLVVDRSLKPVDHFTSTGGNYLNKYGLRDTYVPSDLMLKFLNLVQGNTSSNIETCGILCGKLCNDAFRITHLVIPKQHGTPDSCDTESEEELFDVQDSHNLITLGWIHTHPSQTAFLSSVDLHTHSGYQLMLPEAIAIVCAPKYNETGFFHLTPDYGLNFVSNCRQPGFHPHPKNPALFDTCPHMKLDNTAATEVIDLRRK